MLSEIRLNGSLCYNIFVFFFIGNTGCQKCKNTRKAVNVTPNRINLSIINSSTLNWWTLPMQRMGYSTCTCNIFAKIMTKSQIASSIRLTQIYISMFSYDYDWSITIQLSFMSETKSIEETLTVKRTVPSSLYPA